MLLSICMKVITTNSNSSLSDIFKDTQTQPLHMLPIISAHQAPAKPGRLGTNACREGDV